MYRKEFLMSVGMSAAPFARINCTGCKKTAESKAADTTAPRGVDFISDLSLASNVALVNNRASLMANGVIVARTMTGSYIAVQRSCAHESYPLSYQGANARFYCPNHGATFAESGGVSNGLATRSLTVYHTLLTATLLRGYS